jgi:hypothetical protein
MNDDKFVKMYIQIDMGDSFCDYIYYHEDEQYYYYKSVKDGLGIFPVIKIAKHKKITRYMSGYVIDEVDTC